MTYLSFSFSNERAKNNFLDFVQSKGFRVVSDTSNLMRQDTYSSSIYQHYQSSPLNLFPTTKGQSKQVNKATYNYTVGIEKEMTELDSKYIYIAADYFNYSGVKRKITVEDFVNMIIFCYIIAYVLVFYKHFLNPIWFHIVGVGIGFGYPLLMVFLNKKEEKKQILKFEQELSNY